MGYALDVELILRTLTCGGCGMTFAIPENFYRQYVENGVEIKCPNRS